MPRKDKLPEPEGAALLRRAMENALELACYPPAPKDAKPIARVTGYHAGRCVVEPLDRAAVLPAGMALYAQPVKDEPMFTLPPEILQLELEAIAEYRAEYPTAPPWQELDRHTQSIWMRYAEKQRGRA